MPALLVCACGEPLQVPDELLEQSDHCAKALGLTRAQYVRLAVELLKAKRLPSYEPADWRKHPYACVTRACL